MNDVIDYYAEKAARLGGQQALDDLGIKIAFNLKDPDIIAEIQNRGELVTGKVTQTTLDSFKSNMTDMYMEGGLSATDLKREVEKTFSEKFLDEYRGRAWAIARTEAGTTHSTVQNETYGRNGAKKKQWVATKDMLTRESHVELDGEEVDFDEAFSNGLMFPLEPGGDPGEVINCRCDMIVSEYDENFCQGEGKDTSDCVIPWTGQEGLPEQEAAPDYNDDFKDAYAKPMDKGGAGIMNMMKMSDAEQDLLMKYIDKGQMDKAYTLLGKYSGRTGSTIKNMPAASYKKGMNALKDCKGL
jgi:SPP1 gp7 family putative phage head morphogenesis protein